jgi:hypothetical protein
MDDKPRHGREHPLRPQAEKDISEHLSLYGAKNWKPIIQKYMERGVGEHTVWTWIRAVKKAAPPKPTLVAAKARIEEVLESDVGQHLPVAPSPAYVAKSGERGLRNLDILAELHAIQADAHMLRKHSVAEVLDPETGEVTGERIKNPLLFEKQMQRRLNVIDTSLRAMGEVWNLRTMQDFYEVVVQEIARESPETARRIMVRLAELNARTGMTMDMRV